MSTRDESVEIDVDGGGASIQGTFVTPGVAVPGVLFVHGWGGNQEQYLERARAIAALGCVCLTFDLRGHGRGDSSREEVTREHNLADAVAAYDLLAARRPEERSAIAVIGSSYGAYLAAILTTQRDVAWLGLRAPALYRDSDWELAKRRLHGDDGDLQGYRRQRITPDENRALRACRDFTGDVLLVESEHDDTVPHTTIENYIEACKHARSLTYRVIEGADHGLGDPAAQQAYTALLVSWATEIVLGGAQRASDSSTSGALRPRVSGS